MNYKKHLLALVIVFAIAIYLELLGWRILSPRILLSEALNQTFMPGALRTAAGATVCGMVPVIIGAVPRRTRGWSMSHSVILWSLGAGFFLAAMAGLIAWAP
ncbi:MAG: hypothetical protein Q7W55_08505 [Pseudohongiella sp.]|nr:hypothetical protein [Pseudohongiella sp.]MDP2128489.1 hypothetical protein [Pseudohongiella sp.]